MSLTDGELICIRDEAHVKALRATGSAAEADAASLRAVADAALAAERERREPPMCKWSEHDVGMCDIWNTECGVTWSFIEGGPVENGVRFCHHCGNRVAAPRKQGG